MIERPLTDNKAKFYYNMKEYFPSGFQKLREINRINVEYFYHSLSEI